MKDYQERVIQEKSDLVYKLSKLETFLNNDKSVKIDEWRRLNRQKLIMELYIDVLNERIDAF